MDLALKLDPSKEIEKRFRDMKRVAEESGDLSARSISQSGAPSENKRKVQFASPSKQERQEERSSRYSNSKSGIEESIGESISINESVPSMPAQALASQSKQSYSSKFESSAIKESINEHSRKEYSDNFEESNMQSSRNNKTPLKQLSSYKGTNTESDMVEEDYSQRFDESQPGKALLSSQDERSSSHKTQPNPVKEFMGVEEEEDPVVSADKVRVLQSESGKEVPIDTVSIVESQIN